MTERTNIFPDANYLIFLTRAGHSNAVGDRYLNHLLANPESLSVHITSTVRSEVVHELTFEERQIFYSWINRNDHWNFTTYYSDLVRGNGNGERSIIEAINSLPTGEAIVFSSDTRYPWGAELPNNANVMLSVNSLNQLLFTGAVSYSDYAETLNAMRGIVPEQEYWFDYNDSDAVPRYLMPGFDYQIGNIDLRVLPGGSIQLTDPNGHTEIVPPDGRFMMLSDSSFIVVDDSCFLAGTGISMWDGREKPIEDIAVGDWVTAYDEDGNLVPGRVSHTSRNRVKHILDVHGLMVTPGHVTLCGDGRFAERHVPIIDILRSDGALVTEDGSKVRAATGCLLGSRGDRLIWTVTGERHRDGSICVRNKGLIRLGTRFITPAGHDVSVMDVIADAGGIVGEDGLIQSCVDGPRMPFLWTFTGRLPKPEDYVLQRSKLHLQDIYQTDEWEAVGPQMPAPFYGHIHTMVAAQPERPQAAPSGAALNGQSEPETPDMNREPRPSLPDKQHKLPADKKTDISLH